MPDAKDNRDTIFALSSGRPPAAIAIVRISGQRAGAAMEALAGRLPVPRRATLARLRDPRSSDVLDEGLVLWLPRPKSETGEDMVELHLHGGRAVITSVLEALAHLDGLRMAEPGEFTRRAFENGRLDLTAVEGLGDLIFADTQAQRRQAYRQLKGQLAERAEGWRASLIGSLALVEASIDFSDEADVPGNLLVSASGNVQALRADIVRVLADDRRGERLREGLVVAIAGPPNVGKSSLLNRIARRDAAIVSPHAGTTRDVIEVHLDLEGYPVMVIDTAGIRETVDPVEIEGVRRARARAASADIVLWLSDATEGDKTAAANLNPLPVWRVRNKIDLVGSEAAQGAEDAGQVFAISALTGAGVDRLLKALADHATAVFETGEPALVTRERHREALRDAVEALDRAIAEASGREEVFAEELRLAARALGRLTGRVDVDEILDVIFRDFCIGK